MSRVNDQAPSSDGPPLGDGLAPVTPTTVEDSGLDFGFLADLALKTVYADTSCTTQRAAERLALPPALVDLLLQHLYRERLTEIRETITPQNRRYAMLDRGWERVRRLLDLNAYIGAAPVSLDAYTAMVKRQEAARPSVNPDAIRAAVANLVLSDTTQQLLGVVANSRRSLFITGAPGNGKTSIAQALHLALGGEIWIPRAIEVDGHIINVFDSHSHAPVDPPPPAPYDQRWVKIRLRPDGQILRGPFPGQVQWRHLADRRLRAAAGAAPRSLQPLDHPAGKPCRLPDATHRQEDSGSVRATSDLRQQSGLRRLRGGGLPPAARLPPRR